MSVATDFVARWSAFRFPSGKRGLVGATASEGHFMVLTGGGLWTSFNTACDHVLPWITLDGAGHGNLSAMLHFRVDGRNVWARMRKLVRAEFRDRPPFGVVHTVTEFTEGNLSCRMTARLTFAGGCPGFLVEILGLENMCDESIACPAVYLQANAGGGEQVRPLPGKNGWVYPDGRQTVVSAVEGGHAEFWFQSAGHAHPDVEWKTGGLVLRPKSVWKPPQELSAVYEFCPFKGEDE